MNSTQRTLLVLGGTSDIARATALAFAKRGWTVRLAGRDLAELQREADDIALRSGCATSVHKFDVLDSGSFTAFTDSMLLPDAVVSVVGLMGEQGPAEIALDHAVEVMRSNYEGPALILGLFAERFVTRGGGSIIGVSSVAGDRGRGSNYVYGSAKAGFSAFLSGLRNRMQPKCVHVMTVKPGFVRTRMTENMKLPPLLTADPAEVGEAIFRGVNQRKDVIYVRSIWRWVMLIIRLIPEFLFKRLKL